MNIFNFNFIFCKIPDKKLDNFFEIITLELESFNFLIEFKIKKRQSKEKALEEAVTQIFDKEYYQVFENYEEKPIINASHSEYYIIGVCFSPKMESSDVSVISGYSVKKFIGEKGEFQDPEKWEIIVDN